MTVSIRRIRAEDWPRLRELRLEALRDTPIAYLEAYDAAAALGDDEWRFRAERGTRDARSATFVAEDSAGTWVGMAGAFVADEDRSHATVVAVYVSPAHRGRAAGVAVALMAAVERWAREAAGAPELRLLVHEDNVRAQRFYAGLGFALTGHREPYQLDESRDELEMSRRLD